MRIADTILSPRFKTVIYTLENHWYVEFEAGPMKQGYKLSKEKYPALGDVHQVLSVSFLDGVYQQFNQMFGLLKSL